jgi:PAS domain S-box-containing protein
MAKDDNDLTSQQFAQIVRESPDTYRTTFEVTGTAMVVLDGDATILLANQEMTRLSGYSREEVEGKMTIKDFVHPKHYDKILSYHNMRRSGEGTPPAQYSFQFLDRMGNEKEILVNVRIIPNTNKSVASLIDITENRVWEEKLQQSEEKFRSLFENAQEGIYQSTIDGRILLANPAFVKLLGYDSLEEVMNLNMRKDVYQDETSRDWVISEFGNLDTYENVELSWKKKDGTPIIVRANGRAKKDHQGKIIFYEAMIVDITENKRTEKELQDSQQLFKDIINCLPDPTFAIDKDSKVIAWNRAMEEFTNIKSEQILGLGNYEYSLPIHGKRKPILVDYALSGTLPQGTSTLMPVGKGRALWLRRLRLPCGTAKVPSCGDQPHSFVIRRAI